MLQRRHSPMEYDGQRMPIESFHGLWRTPGFKYEYGHGRVNISVQRSAAPIVVSKPSTIKESVSGASSSLSRTVVGSARNASAEELKRLWIIKSTLLCEVFFLSGRLKSSVGRF